MSGGTSRWSVYVLRCGDGSLYTGIATDVARRLAEHRSGLKGARYLRGREPLELVFQAEIGGRSMATRAELKIKALGKQAKERLVCSRCDGAVLLSVLGLAGAD